MTSILTFSDYFGILTMIRHLTTEKLFNLTNCKPPCSYYKYDIVKKVDMSASVDESVEGFGK